jgi:hypothetical protein
MPTIVFHTDAAEEMQATAAYYAGRAPGLGEAFLDEIEQGLRRIQEFPHSIGLCGGACHHSSKASGGEDLDIEEPVSGWDCSPLHFHPTLPGMLSPTLIGGQVIPAIPHHPRVIE